MRTTLKRKGIFGGNYSVRDVEGRLLMTPICVHMVLASLQSFNVVMHWPITFRPSSILVSRVRVPLCRHQESRPPLGKVQHRKFMNHELHITLRMLRVKPDKSDWLGVRNEFSANAQKISDPTRGRDSKCCPNGALPLRTRMAITCGEGNQYGDVFQFCYRSCENITIDKIFVFSRVFTFHLHEYILVFRLIQFNKSCSNVKENVCHLIRIV